MHQQGVHVIVAVTTYAVRATDAQRYTISLEVQSETAVQIRHVTLADIVASGVGVVTAIYSCCLDICVRVLELVLVYGCDVVVSFLSVFNQVGACVTEASLVGIVVCRVGRLSLFTDTFVMNHVVVCGGVTYGHTTGHYHALLRTILVVAVDRHLEHLVAIVTAVDAQIQLNITHIQQVTLQVKLDTMVLHGGVVDIVSAVTQRRCYVAREEHVIRFLVEEIELCIQVFGNRELQTEVHCTGALPGQLGVAFVAPYICLLAVYVLYIIAVGKHHVADILVTQNTPT